MLIWHVRIVLVLVWLNVAPGINSRYLTLDIGILKLNLTPFFLGIFIYLSICEKLSTSQKPKRRESNISLYIASQFFPSLSLLKLCQYYVALGILCNGIFVKKFYKGEETR